MVATLITSAAANFPARGDACTLLTKEDAARALGEAASGPKAPGPMSDGTGAIVELHVIKRNAFLSLELRRSGNPTEPLKAVMENALAKLT
jgi:hypothetical protein